MVAPNQLLFRRSSKSLKYAPFSSSQGSRVVRAGPEKAPISRLCSCIFPEGCHSWSSVRNHPEALRGLRGAGTIPLLVQTSPFPSLRPRLRPGVFFRTSFSLPTAALRETASSTPKVDYGIHKPPARTPQTSTTDPVTSRGIPLRCHVPGIHPLRAGVRTCTPLGFRGSLLHAFALSSRAWSWRIRCGLSSVPTPSDIRASGPGQGSNETFNRHHHIDTLPASRIHGDRAAAGELLDPT